MNGKQSENKLTSSSGAKTTTNKVNPNVKTTQQTPSKEKNNTGNPVSGKSSLKRDGGSLDPHDLKKTKKDGDQGKSSTAMKIEKKENPPPKISAAANKSSTVSKAPPPASSKSSVVSKSPSKTTGTKSSASKATGSAEKKKELQDSDEKKTKQRGWKKIKYYGDGENKQKRDGDMIELEGGEAADEEEIDLELPYWLKDLHVRDKNMKKIGQEGYDPTSLYIPEHELKGNTAVMRQYWDIKKNHFDKLVAFKLWKFYFFYFNDGLIVHRLVDSGLHMDGKRFFTYFHESNMAKYAPKILQAGHKVVIVEQMEDVFTKEETLVRREVCQVLTRGSYTDITDADYASRFTLCIFEYELHFGIVYMDTTTHEFYVGEFEDDPYRSSLRTLLTRIKPIEIVYITNYISIDSLKIFRGLANKPTLTPSTVPQPYYLKVLWEKIKKYFTVKGTAVVDYPELLEKMYVALESNLNEDKPEFLFEIFQRERKLPFYHTLQALVICLVFLENILLAETIFGMGEFLPFDISLDKKATLYIDGQALANLEILEVSYISSLNDNSSLFGYMDKTVTAFGRRMLKRWITSPLMDPEKINERLDAVDDLIRNSDIADFFHDRISKFPDFERMVGRIYNLSHKQRMSAAYFEDFAKNRLKDFLQLLTELKKVEKAVEFFGDYVESFRCKRLVQLTTFKDVDIEAFKQKKKPKGKKSTEGIFPRINHIIADLEAMVKIQEGLPMPAPGVSKANDELLVKIDAIRANLQKYLDEQRKYFKSKDINYVHARLRYELEIPENLVSRASQRPKEFVITSKRSGYLRFHTPQIEEYMGSLFRLENEFQQILIQFIVELFQKFYQRHSYWQQVVSCLAELDCLCSLARLARTMGHKCRPVVLSAGQENVFELKGMVHPTILKKNPNFVPNDVLLEDSKNVFLITGPNMGGKSTLLRQTCIAVIMAQLGSYVPASSFTFTAKDRIFTRIGAADRILEGKSTFFIEMEETYSIVKEATNNSLLIIDELGRGTSTYDGIAIAYAVLKYITEKFNCMTMFATHYHILLEEFKLYDNIQTYIMEADFNEETDEIKFLYKFIKGQAASSHGTVIAKHAGLPSEVIARAKEKAMFMTKEKKNISSEKAITESVNKIISELTEMINLEENNEEIHVDNILKNLSQFKE